MHLIAHVIYGMIIFRISSSRVLRSNRTDTFRGATFILKKKARVYELRPCRQRDSAISAN